VNARLTQIGTRLEPDWPPGWNQVMDGNGKIRTLNGRQAQSFRQATAIVK